MSDLHARVIQDLKFFLFASLVLDPLGPGLTKAELQQAAADKGISAPNLTEVFPSFWRDRVKGPEQTIRATHLDLVQLVPRGGLPSPCAVELLPQLREAFERLEERNGVRSGKSLHDIAMECAILEEKVAAALGIALTMEFLERTSDGFRRRGYSPNWSIESDPSHPATEPLKAAMMIVEPIIAARNGAFSALATPIQRFHSFLRKQGMEGLAGWWAGTTQEVSQLWGYYPTAATVLAGALLETALVAIAEPAKKAGEWNQSFLNDPPERWKLQKLIDQAEAAKTFSKNQAAHARTLAECRNRIHAGIFAVNGPDRFRPPRTNQHEAQLTRTYLDLLLGAILDWKPIASLS